MVGTTLDDIRRYVESLASDSGEYSLVCARTGDRPVPAVGLTFETRASARAAARATEQYRAALRRYDPQVPYYDVIVCQRPSDGVGSGGCDGSGTDRPTEKRVRTEPSMIDFCHTVAGAVFEAVAASSHADVERAIMDTYFDVAESTTHPDELCLTLVQSMATELDAAFEPTAQLELLQSAAMRLPPRRSNEMPIESTLLRLQTVTALTAFSVESTATDPATGPWTVTLEEYAFGRSADRLVTLPLALELLRRRPRDGLAIATVERPADRPPGTWQVVVTPTELSAANGLVYATSGCVP